jgi:hypothetical protein
LIELGRKRQTEAELLLATEQARFDFPDVFRLVNPLQMVDVRRPDLDNFLRAKNTTVQQHVLRDTEFIHRKWMARRQIKFQFL